MSLQEFRALLATGRKLRIKFGADVTAGSLHLGHAVNLWMMREMQERGHLVQFLIGDFTTRIGDPTGRAGARVPPSREAIERDASAFIAQVGRVLVTDDPSVFEVRRNSEWWDDKGIRAYPSSRNPATRPGCASVAAVSSGSWRGRRSRISSRRGSWPRSP